MLTYNIAASNNTSLDLVCSLYDGYRDEMDSIGNPLKFRNPLREVFCAEIPIPSSEFFSAGQNGIKAETELLIDSESYENEKNVIFDGIDYDIYRVYRRQSGITELYLRKAAESYE